MSQKISSRDRDLLERFLDGHASPDDIAQCERRLASDEQFRCAHDELRRLRDLLAGADRIDADPVFWAKLQGKMREEEEEKLNLLPFPQKYLPLAASGFALLVLFSFSYVFNNRLSFLRFWESQSEAVRTAYEKTLQESSFIPLFSGIDNDKTLQFALYGSLLLDESRGTMLNVDERSAEGYRIEVQKEQPRKQKKVTVADFVAEVRPTNVQKAAIESLLNEGRRELESAVLVGMNESVAINADLNRLNRAMASGIISMLEPDQRTRLKRLLTQDDAAYAFTSRSRAATRAQATGSVAPVPPTTNQFVVLSPETVLIRALTVDVGRIQREMRESQERFREVQAMRERSIRWLVNEPVLHAPGAQVGVVAPRISFRSRKDRLTIQIQSDTSTFDFFLVEEPEGGVFVGAGDSAEQFELRMLETPQGGVYIQGGDSASRFQFRLDQRIPSPTGVVVPPDVRVRPVPRPDSARTRRPFKLDID